MPRVGDYATVQAAAFTLDPAGPTFQEIQFNLPTTLDAGAPSILLYQADHGSFVGAPNWKVSINNRQIARYELDGKGPRSLNEIVPDNLLLSGPGNPNTIRFELDTAVGADPMTFSGIAIFWQNIV